MECVHGWWTVGTHSSRCLMCGLWLCSRAGSTFVYALFGKPMSEIEYDALMLGIFGLSTSSKIKAYYQVCVCALGSCLGAVG